LVDDLRHGRGPAQPAVFVKAMMPSTAEAHRLAVAEHARVVDLATQAVREGRLSAFEAAKIDAMLGDRQAVLEATRPRHA
jgi:hypothetical protein